MGDYWGHQCGITCTAPSLLLTGVLSGMDVAAIDLQMAVTLMRMCGETSVR